MIDLEQRLRDELPQLADALVDEPAHADVEHVPTSRRFSLLLAAAAVIALVVGLGWFANQRSRDDAVAKPPPSFGSWRPIAEAPIPLRSFAASTWTGDEAVFLSGSNLARNFAYSEAATYDPVTDDWEQISGTGWGHPGLVSTTIDGEMILAAKGSFTAFDPSSGTTTDLPGSPGGIWLQSALDVDGELWAVGLSYPDQDVDAPHPIVVARLDRDVGRWIESGARFEPSWAWDDSQWWDVSYPMWSGSEIVVATPAGGAAFNPATATWRELPSIERATGSRGSLQPNDVVASRTMTNGEDVAMAVATRDGRAVILRLERQRTSTESRWNTVAEIDIAPTKHIDGVMVDDWLIVFATNAPPLTVHLPTGRWESAPNAPIAGVTAPNTVWTGSELIVWGGERGEGATADGAIWTPPDPTGER